MTYNINVSNTYNVNNSYPSPENTATDKGPEILSYKNLTDKQRFCLYIGEAIDIKEDIDGMGCGVSGSPGLSLTHTLGLLIGNIYLEFDGKMNQTLIMKKITYALKCNEGHLSDLRCYTNFVNQNPNIVFGGGSFDEIVKAIKTLGF